MTTNPPEGLVLTPEQIDVVDRYYCHPDGWLNLNGEETEALRALYPVAYARSLHAIRDLIATVRSLRAEAALVAAALAVVSDQIEAIRRQVEATHAEYPLGASDARYLLAIAAAARNVPRPRETDLMLGDADWWEPLQAAIAGERGT